MRELVAHPRGTERPYLESRGIRRHHLGVRADPHHRGRRDPGRDRRAGQGRTRQSGSDAPGFGGGLHTLLKTTVYLADLSEFDDYNAAYLDRLEGIPLPPRTTVEVARFRGSKRIEIDAVAAVDHRIDKHGA